MPLMAKASVPSISRIKYTLMIRSPFLSGDPRKNQAAKIENLFQKNPGSSSRQRFFSGTRFRISSGKGTGCAPPAAPEPCRKRPAARQELPAGQGTPRRMPRIATGQRGAQLHQKLSPHRKLSAAQGAMRSNGNSPQHKALPPHGALSSAPDYRRSSSTSSGTPSAARLRMIVSGLRMPDTSGFPGSTR